MPERQRPYVHGNFRVKIGDASGESVEAGFQEVLMPTVSTEVIEYRNGNEKENRPRKIHGNYQVGNVVLKRGLIGSANLWEWFEEVRHGEQAEALRPVTIELLDESTEEVAVAWHLTNSRPVTYRFSNLEAGGDDIVLEIVELAVEDIDMEFP